MTLVVVASCSNVYLCTGDPTPGDIAQISSYLLNENFQDALTHTRTLMTAKGYALQDVLTRLSAHVRAPPLRAVPHPVPQHTAA